LKKGKPVVGIIFIPKGGYIKSNTTEGENEEWKKAQKKPENNIISEKINNKNPFFKPILTTSVWDPINVDSSTISCNQKNEHNNTQKKPYINIIWLKLVLWSEKPIPEKRINILKANKIGQGLGATKLNKCLQSRSNIIFFHNILIYKLFKIKKY